MSFIRLLLLPFFWKTSGLKKKKKKAAQHSMENTVDNRDTRTEETVGERPTWCPTDTLLCRLLAHFINLTQLFYFFI